MIKCLITSGCSFSPRSTTSGWTGEITKKFESIYPELISMHRGLPSQGQELIQKKAVFAIVEALNKGYKPEEIAVVVMWSGTERTAWYIDNPDIMRDILLQWKLEFNSGWSCQFFDLENKSSSEKIGLTKNNNEIVYDPNGGWYFTNGHGAEIEFIKQYFMFDKDIPGIGMVHKSLENMIFLQNFCKVKNIKLCQQFYMDHVFTDILKHKDHKAINYLYKELDFDTILLKSIYNYLQPNTEYFMDDNIHPNDLGAKVYSENVLIPFLESKGFFQ